MNYKVLSGKEDDFERACRKVMGVMKSMKGHSRSHIYKDIDESNSYLIISDWHDRGAFDSFVKSEAFVKVANWGKEQILMGRPKHDFYTPQQ
jgi:heme-degrading monooxygenase HmoA